MRTFIEKFVLAYWVLVAKWHLNFFLRFDGLDYANPIFSQCILSRRTTLTTWTRDGIPGRRIGGGLRPKNGQNRGQWQGNVKFTLSNPFLPMMEQLRTLNNDYDHIYDNECWVYLAKFTWCNAKVSSAVAYDKNQLIYVVCTPPQPQDFWPCPAKKNSPSIPDLQQLIKNKRIAINEPTICTNVVWDEDL